MDLNLLAALDALLEENSVQAAADRMHLSAPAMSRTLSRIRAATGDDILVRTGRTMTPTPRALEIRDEVRELVARAGDVLSRERRLDLHALQRTFTIQGHDALVIGLTASLAGRAAAEAPGVSFRILGEATTDTADLARGHVDLDLGSTVPASPELSHVQAGEDHMVVVMRSGHPLADDLNQATYAAAEHLIVSRRGRLRDGVDKLLADHGLSRRVVVTVPSVGLALPTIASTDLICVMPERASVAARAAYDVTHREPPVPLPPAPVILSWHRRYDSDPAHRWMREHCRRALRDLLRQPDVDPTA